eukprot:979679-Amphidinium_carterae.1
MEGSGASPPLALLALGRAYLSGTGLGNARIALCVRSLQLRKELSVTEAQVWPRELSVLGFVHAISCCQAKLQRLSTSSAPDLNEARAKAACGRDGSASHLTLAR